VPASKTFIHTIVDFAGSGAAMTDEQIAKVANGVVLLPITAGELALANNLPDGSNKLKLPRDVYPDDSGSSPITLDGATPITEGIVTGWPGRRAAR
jgi:hypothetical protein